MLVGGKFYEQSSYLVKAKDTMGAGDSFITSFLVNYLEGSPAAVDFGESSGKRGIVKAEEYLDELIRLSLYRAAVFASGQCQRDGSFGYGREVELTDKDVEIMESNELLRMGS